MADITILQRLVNGISRNVDISANTLVTTSIKVGGGVSNTELTKAILDRLVALQNGSDVDATYHTHDGRYFTETELGSSGASSGSDLIGDDDTYANFTPAAATIKGALSGIDSALASISSDAADITYTPSVLTDWDGDADPGNVDAALDQLAERVDDNEIAIADNTTDIADLVTLSGVAANSTDLGSFTGSVIPTSQTIKQALQSVSSYAENTRSLVNNFEWSNSALDYITDNTAAPPTEVSGDRYVLSHDGGAPNAAWDGASAGDIVEFNGTSWVATTPSLGQFISIDDESSVLYYWGGSSWTTKAFEATTASTGLTKVGFDIQLADAAAANGIVISSGSISVSLASDPGLEFTSGSLRALVDPAGALERVTAGLDVKDGGIDTARLAATSVTAAKLGNDVAGDGLQGGNGSALAVDASAIAGTGLEDDGSENLRIATTAYDQDTLTGGGGSAAAVQKAPLLEEVMVAGESFAANSSFLVRMALNGETAGRIYKADKDAGAENSETNTIYVIGLAQNRTASAITAGNNIPVVKLGIATLQSADTAFTATQDEGLPVYLGDAGAFTLTVPSTTNDAIVLVGSVRNVGGSSAIEIRPSQIIGVN